MIDWLLAAILVAGTVPRELDASARVSWLSEDGTLTGCSRPGPHDWVCEFEPPEEGLVVMSDDSRVAYEPVDGRGRQGDLRVARWGRLLVLATADPDDLEEVRISAWKPEFSPNHPHATRLRRVDAPTIRTIRLGRSAAWIAGLDDDSEGVVSIDGPAIASARVPVFDLKDGLPELAVFIPLSTPQTLHGRVQDARGRDVPGVDVELFEPVPKHPDQEQDVTSVSRATARSDDAGEFSFGGLGDGPFLVVASETAKGRGIATIRSVTDPLVISLKPPSAIVGRVIQHATPAAGVRVRFIPAVEAFRASADPRDLGTGESQTDAGGWFMLALPPQRAGVLWVAQPDGPAIRVPVPGPGSSGDINLGDIALPDPLMLTVRVLDSPPCVVTAVGPLAGLGMSVIQAATVVGNEHGFDVPEPGDWALDAVCGGARATLLPTVVHVPADGRPMVFDVQRARTP